MLQDIKSKMNSDLKSCFLQTTRNPHIISIKRFPFHFFSCFCSQQNHYRTLGLMQNATAGQIKSKFYELSRTHHPDMNPSSSSSAERFKQISEAYNVLSDRNLRQQYDHTITTSYSSSSGGTYASRSPDYSSPGNAARRQNANYAWSTRRSRTSFRSDPRHDPLSGKSPAEEFSATLNRFERLARRKQSAANASSSHTFNDPWLHPNSYSSRRVIPKPSAAKQTIQLAFMLSFILWIGSKFHM